MKIWLRPTADLDPASLHSPNGDFPSTRWTEIRGAADKNPTALTRLVEQYEPALSSFLTRCLRIPQDKAEDILQDFLTRKLLEKNILQEAEAARGRFRNFIRTALRNFAFNWLRDQKIGGLPREGAPRMLSGGDPFDVEWALQVIDKAIARMKRDCEEDGRLDLWGIFEGRILFPTLQDAEPVSYRSLTRQYGFENPAAAQNALVTAKRRFIRALEQIVATYEAEPTEIKEEIANLFAILAGSGARLYGSSGRT